MCFSKSVWMHVFHVSLFDRFQLELNITSRLSQSLFQHLVTRDLCAKCRKPCWLNVFYKMPKLCLLVKQCRHLCLFSIAIPVYRHCHCCLSPFPLVVAIENSVRVRRQSRLVSIINHTILIIGCVAMTQVVYIISFVVHFLYHHRVVIIAIIEAETGRKPFVYRTRSMAGPILQLLKKCNCNNSPAECTRFNDRIKTAAYTDK